MNTSSGPVLQQDARRDQWLQKVERLVHQVAEWARLEGWRVETYSQRVHEQAIGDYEAAAVRVELPQGQVFLTPVALDVAGGQGRIDIEAIPTLSRVKLLGTAQSDQWLIMTDSNIPLRLPWSRETFAQLAIDLLN